MSHSTVIVTGENVDEQLAPFDENVQVPPERETVTLDELKTMLEHYRKNPPTAKTKLGKLVRQSGQVNFAIQVFAGHVVEPAHDLLRAFYQDWTGRELFHDEAGYYGYSRYNPQSKWDWYQVGGRWTGYFKPKNGAAGALGAPGVFKNEPEPGWVDIIRKGDIDIEGMREIAGSKAGAHWDEVHAVITTPIRDFEPWTFVRARICGVEGSYDQGKIDLARQAYNDQPIIKATADVRDFYGGDEVIVMTREAYVGRARAGALVPFAILHNGTWHEQGSMGWFGMARDEKDDEAWAREANGILESLPDDTLLTLVDVHI